MDSNITNLVQSVNFSRKISPKTNNPYHELSITFIDGYTFKCFPNSDQVHIISKLASLSDESTSKAKSNDNSFLNE